MLLTPAVEELNKGAANPVVYLLTGYFKNDLPVSKLTPLTKYFLLIAQSSQQSLQQFLQHFLQQSLQQPLTQSLTN